MEGQKERSMNTQKLGEKSRTVAWNVAYVLSQVVLFPFYLLSEVFHQVIVGVSQALMNTAVSVWQLKVHGESLYTPRAAVWIGSAGLLLSVMAVVELLCWGWLFQPMMAYAEPILGMSPTVMAAFMMVSFTTLIILVDRLILIADSVAKSFLTAVASVGVRVAMIGITTAIMAEPATQAMLAGQIQEHFASQESAVRQVAIAQATAKIQETSAVAIDAADKRTVTGIAAVRVNVSTAGPEADKAWARLCMRCLDIAKCDSALYRNAKGGACPVPSRSRGAAAIRRDLNEKIAAADAAIAAATQGSVDAQLAQGRAVGEENNGHVRSLEAKRDAEVAALGTLTTQSLIEKYGLELVVPRNDFAGRVLAKSAVIAKIPEFGVLNTIGHLIFVLFGFGVLLFKYGLMPVESRLYFSLKAQMAVGNADVLALRPALRAVGELPREETHEGVEDALHRHLVNLLTQHKLLIQGLATNFGVAIDDRNERVALNWERYILPQLRLYQGYIAQTGNSHTWPEGYAEALGFTPEQNQDPFMGLEYLYNKEVAPPPALPKEEARAHWWVRLRNFVFGRRAVPHGSQV